MAPYKKLLMAASVALAVQFTPGAYADEVFIFDTGNIATSTTDFNVEADEITLTSLGDADITITDTGDGVLSPAINDTFVETGLVSAVNFQLGGANVFGTGIGVEYELLAVYDLGGFAGTSGTDLIALITSGSGTIFYDETLDNAVSVGAVAVATLSIPPGGGDCIVTEATGFTEGSCKIIFDFSASGGGIWTVDGADLFGNLTDSITVDININNSTPPVSAVFPGGPFSSQFIQVDHDGSAVINVPEPGTLALFGMALLGFGFSRLRRRA